VILWTSDQGDVAAEAAAVQPPDVAHGDRSTRTPLPPGLVAIPQQVADSGYRYVMFRGRRWWTHRLVAQAWVPLPAGLDPRTAVISHRRSRAQNTPDSLFWTTRGGARQRQLRQALPRGDTGRRRHLYLIIYADGAQAAVTTNRAAARRLGLSEMELDGLLNGNVARPGIQIREVGLGGGPPVAGSAVRVTRIDVPTLPPPPAAPRQPRTVAGLAAAQRGQIAAPILMEGSDSDAEGEQQRVVVAQRAAPDDDEIQVGPGTPGTQGTDDDDILIA
jgi:hypothetical protein